jgi:hypothetical protein
VLACTIERCFPACTRFVYTAPRFQPWEPSRKTIRPEAEGAREIISSSEIDGFPVSMAKMNETTEAICFHLVFAQAKAATKQ